MLSFQGYVTVGIAIMSLLGMLLVFLDRMGSDSAARLLSPFILFPFIYILAILPKGTQALVAVDEEFAIFREIPFLVVFILLFGFIAAICLTEARGKWLGIGYLSAGSLISLGMRWSLSDPFVLIVGGFSALTLLVEGGLMYKEGRRREKEEMRVLALVGSGGEVRIENVMAGLQMSDEEARGALQELWRKGRLEKREQGTVTIYYTPPRAAKRRHV